MPQRNFFEMLGIKPEELKGLAEADARSRIHDAFSGRFNENQRRTRPLEDGTTQKEWGELLKQAKDCLLDPDCRRRHVAKFSGTVPEPEPSSAGSSKPPPRPAPAGSSKPPPRPAPSFDFSASVGIRAAVPATVLYLLARGFSEPSMQLLPLITLVVSALLVWAGARLSLFILVPLVGWMFTSSHLAFDSAAEVLSLAKPLEVLFILGVFLFVGAVGGAMGYVLPWGSLPAKRRASATVQLLMAAGALVWVVATAVVALDPGDVRVVALDPGDVRAAPEEPVVLAPREVEEALDLDARERRRIQSGLRALGYYTGSIDGLVGPGTRGAIRQWQRTQTGVATSYLDGPQAQALMALAPAPEPDSDRSAPPRPVAQEPDGSRLVVRAEPDSRITIDGDASGVTNDAGILVVDEVQPGEHVLVAEKDGYDTVTRVIEVESGRSDVVELALEASPGRLSVTANVDGAAVSVDGGEWRLMPFEELEVPSGVRQVTVARVGYDPVVEQVEVSPGELATIDVDLEPVNVEEGLPLVRQVFEAGNYELAVTGAQPLANLMELWEGAGIDVTGPFAEVQAILGRSFYELGRFQESLVPLYRAVLLGQEIVLPVNHRHGGGGFREGFCRGFLSMSLKEVAFRSMDDPDHGFAVPPRAVNRVQVAQRIQGHVFRMDTEIEGRGSVDFVHVNAQRQARDPESGLVVDLVCSDCDRSLEVVQAILTRLSQS